jgi:hypothetical protein
MKIGILGTRGIPNRYGGFEECAEHLAIGLVGKGHEVTVYNTHDHEFQGPDWNGVRIIHCKDPEARLGTAGQFIYDWNCISHARKQRYDVVLQLGYTSSSVWWWRWPKHAVNLVNMDGMEWKRSKYGPKVQAFLRWAESWAAKHAHGLIADSLGIQDHLRQRYGKNARYIAYGAALAEKPDAAVLQNYDVRPEEYFMLMARMEPENNVEMIIRGYIESGSEKPLLITGNTGNQFGTMVKDRYGANPGLRFIGGVYDAAAVNALRHYSCMYFHGHSVGGTNPSLLAAMGSDTRIAAHDNPFNASVLGDDAFYFQDAAGVADLIRSCCPKEKHTAWLDSNRNKIRDIFNWPAIIDAYEALMLEHVAPALPPRDLQVAEAELIPDAGRSYSFSNLERASARDCAE